jgi:glycosyltransferase involved in cell wall biosynthesis
MRPYRLCVEFKQDERWLGGAIYVVNLLSSLGNLREVERPMISLVLRRGADISLAKKLAGMPIVSGAQRISVRYRSVQKLNHLSRGRLTWLLRRIRPVKREGEREELWFPAFARSIVPRRELYWITDLQHRHMPHLFSQDELEQRDRWFADIAEGPGHLVLSSQSARADFLQLYPNARVKSHVWHFCSTLRLNGSGFHAEVRSRYGLPEKFVYIPNQFWKHKDHLTALTALFQLRTRGIIIPLVCTGFQGDYRQPDHFAEVEGFIRATGLVDQVKLLGVIPRTDQVEVFRIAAAVLQPSLFEGWSTVIEDARAIGRPILASDIDVHREQLRGVEDAAFFRAGDAGDLAETLAVLWPEWKAGPDYEREAEAQVGTERRTIDAAREFVSIADEAAGLATAPQTPEEN